MIPEEDRYFLRVIGQYKNFLVASGRVMAPARRNYVAWLKFLSKNHVLGPGPIDVDAILRIEEAARQTRRTYKRKADVLNFKVALDYYAEFLVSPMHLHSECSSGSRG